MEFRLEDLDREKIKEALEGRLMRMRVIHGAQSGGILVFAVVVWALAKGGGDAAGDTGFLPILSLLHAGAALVCAVVGTWMFNMQFSRKYLEKALGRMEEGRESRMIAQFQTAHILRLSIYEGAVFFGLVVCFLAGSQGVLRAAPEYQANFLTPLLFLIYSAMTFPTAERVGREVGQVMGMGALY